MTNVFDTHLSRRRLIAGGTAAVLGTAGLAVATDGAEAQASVGIDGGLDIEPGEFSPDDGELFSVWVLATGEWGYRVETQPAKWEAYLLIGDGGGNAEPVAVTDGETTALEATGTYGLRGAITASGAWGPSDFRLPDGAEEHVVEIPVEIAYVVRDAGDAMLAQARAADTATVTVTPGGVAASVGGSATLVGQDDSDSPTPTPPEGG